MLGNIFHIQRWYPTEYDRSYLIAEIIGVNMIDFWESQFPKAAAQNRRFRPLCIEPNYV